jgi:hypothetical protein
MEYGQLLRPQSPPILRNYVRHTTRFDEPVATLLILGIAHLSQLRASASNFSGGAMEAASARMAARDRYGAFGEAPSSPLQRYIRMHHAIVHLRTRTDMAQKSTSLRSAKLRAQFGLESRNLRLDQQQERLSVGSGHSTAIY